VYTPFKPEKSKLGNIRMKTGPQSVSDLMPAALKSGGSETPQTASVKKSVGSERKTEKALEAAVVIPVKKEALKIEMKGKRKPFSIRLDEAVIELLKRNASDPAAAVSDAILQFAQENGWK
jgi:uncharacterized protein (DUF4415 family)